MSKSATNRRFKIMASKSRRRVKSAAAAGSGSSWGCAAQRACDVSHHELIEAEHQTPSFRIIGVHHLLRAARQRRQPSACAGCASPVCPVSGMGTVRSGVAVVGHAPQPGLAEDPPCPSGHAAAREHSA